MTSSLPWFERANAPGIEMGKVEKVGHGIDWRDRGSDFESTFKKFSLRVEGGKATIDIEQLIDGE